MLMVKSYENIEKYKLAALYNLLKSHEPDVVGRRSEMASSGSLALVSKEEQDSSDEDIAAYVVDDNGDTPKPEIFTSKEENSKLSTPKPSEKLTSESTKEKSEEKKISGDSGYDCNYCHGKNHFAKDCMLRKQNEKKPQVKDEAYYARKLEEVRCFLMDTSEKSNGEEKLDADVTSGLGFVTSEAHKMIIAGTPKTWIDDSSDDDEELCLMANDARLTIPEQVSHLLSSFKIPASQSAPIIHEITRDCFVMHKLLIDAKNREVLTEQELLSLRGRVESQKLALEKANLRICLLEENREKFLNNHDVILKQRNIFCETAKRLYAHITRIYHSADVCNVQHRQLLPFIEFKLKEVDSISYECESIISGSEVTNPSYKHGLISIEKHLTADNLLKILPQEIPILKKAVPLFERKDEGNINNNSNETSESDSNMEEIDCSSLTLLKSSSTSESHPEDISQLSSEDKGKSKECCESKLTKIKETSKLKLQITDESDSYDQFLNNDSKRLVNVAYG
ncbi:hypothetical protein L1887_35486 [Cichorium endivia]|nr:hypothetical protein L1887_35486 [Cichorium endivia]